MLLRFPLYAPSALITHFNHLYVHFIWTANTSLSYTLLTMPLVAKPSIDDIILLMVPVEFPGSTYPTNMPHTADFTRAPQPRTDISD
jgi:hypothetical protein